MSKEYLVDNRENERLARQGKLLQKYLLGDWYERLLSRKHLKVLDVGSNNGNGIMSVVLPKFDNIDRLVGLEKNENCVDEANANYGSDRVQFFAVDVESHDFERQLKNIMKQCNVNSFDLINITSLLLLLKHPDTFLKSISQFLSKDGEIFILDIDDGFTKWHCESDRAKYYDQIYSRAMQICFKSKTTGNRSSGRNVLGYLNNCNLNDCEILNEGDDEVYGLNTSTMPMEDREAFAYMLFDFIERGITATLIDDPQNPELISDYEWFNANKSNLIEGFMDSDLSFNLGYMIFGARGKEKSNIYES